MAGWGITTSAYLRSAESLKHTADANGAGSRPLPILADKASSPKERSEKDNASLSFLAFKKEPCPSNHKGMALYEYSMMILSQDYA